MSIRDERNKKRLNHMEKTSCKVCVTGGAGYIASYLVNKLLQKGYTVHATLRNLDDEAKVRLLRSFAGAETGLKLFQADIYNPDEFEEAIRGCEFVFHVATPMHHTEGFQEYVDSKTLTEKEILSYGNDSNGGLEVVTLGCGLVGGDSLMSQTPLNVVVLISHLTNNPYHYQLLRTLKELLGKVLIIHIDDVCEAHIFFMEKPSIQGRFLCSSSYISSA